MILRLSRFVRTACMCAMLTSAGCKGLTDTPDLPAGTQDISAFFNPTGAETFYRSVVYSFGVGMGYAALATGIFSDELRSGYFIGNMDLRNIPANNGPLPTTDIRLLERGFGIGMNMTLYGVRADAMQAIGILKEFSDAPGALRGHLLAIIGYSELQLAEMYCSGIPLSTVDFKGDWTYKAGSTTSETLLHAIAKFDSAIALSADSARIVNFARVGKGRALLGLGRYADAAAAVADVPANYLYQQTMTWKSQSTFDDRNKYSVADRKGGAGLPYISANDRRTDTLYNGGTNRFGRRMYMPRKYPINTPSQLTIASGLEAGLIRAEAKLQDAKYGEWLGELNTLRQTAISPALPDLTDPGAMASRVDTLFKERAFWMFVTGHRLGDMRRLIRQYGRDMSEVYPTGPYPGWDINYGDQVAMPITASELANPLFTGCKSNDA